MLDEFDKEGFMNWLHKTVFQSADNWFSVEMVENLIKYGVRYHGHTKDGLAYFLSDIIPGVEFSDIVKFCDPKTLTKDALQYLNQ